MATTGPPDPPDTMGLPKGMAALSDLHGECQLRRAKTAIARVVDGTPGLKLLTLAGDVGNVHDGSLAAVLRAAAEACGGAVVTFTPGNHDYYGLSAAAAGDDPADALLAADATLQALCEDAGCVFLQQSAVAVGATVVAGATLWTPVLLATPEQASYMADYARVDGLTTGVVHAVHRRHAAWLYDVCTDPSTSPQVVVTHHAPLDTPRLRSRHYTPRTAPLFHAPGVAESVLTHAGCGTRVWVFGHTHMRGGVRVARARVVVNCLGHAHSDRLWSMPATRVPDRGRVEV